MNAKKRKRSSAGQRRFGTTLAYIRWFDSVIYRDGDHQAEDVTGYMENESAGILIRDTKDEVVIALDRCLDTKNLRLILCVPKANIRAMRKIRM